MVGYWVLLGYGKLEHMLNSPFPKIKFVTIQYEYINIHKSHIQNSVELIHTTVASFS